MSDLQVAHAARVPVPVLDVLDQDGALREAEAALGSSRAAFLKRAGVGGAALLGSGAVLGAFSGIADAAVSASDVAILNFALTLEFLEATFYARAKRNNIGLGNPDLTAFVNTVADHEAKHVAFLKKALGSHAIAKPKFHFGNAVTDQQKFMSTAQALEDTGVRAYLGQVPNIKSKAILKAAGSILPIEARHAAWIRDINSTFTGHNPSPAPKAFQPAQSMKAILEEVKDTGFIVR